ncbi:DNA (cytosine-5)-methyltransferase 1 [Desulfitobacterium sp. LBE]|uniref:DNA cytosine methyltransferase n=1 Tax=Desulfitobacterium sp. LBE TaxID=884086 RepID=UPI00119B20A7|nr:DNA cytosine methyltransferase [Desulfitobacterium sp. LBE]TWH59562.1 DNA (cytosine-5)-methyltransferase 1 [Desulfitobacterium sp. LBE]
MNITLTLGSLFDGIGGFPLAGSRQGFIPLWASEIEPFPIAVTKTRFPEMIHLGDIMQLKGWELPPVDAVCGGSPCQDLSVAGKRAGLQGQRSGLFMEQIRIIKEMRAYDKACGRADVAVRPRYMVWENVPGAFSSADGEDFRAVLEETCRIADSTVSVPRPPGGVWKSAGAILGYEFSVAWRVYDAQYWSVPQRRRRIFLVADFGGRTAPQILFEQDRLLGDFAPGGETGQGAAPGSQAGAGDPSRYPAGDRGTDRESLTSGKRQYPVAFACNQRDEVRDLHDVAGAVQAQPGLKQQTFIAAFSAGQGAKAGGIGYQEECAPTLKASESGTNMVPSILCLNDQGGNRMDVTENITATLRAQMDGHPPLVLGGEPELFENHGIDSRYTGPHEVAPTMSARYGTGGNNVPLVSQPSVFPRDSGKDTPPEETYCIAGNTIDRQDHNGGNGIGFQPDASDTLNAANRHCVFSQQRSDEYLPNQVTSTQSARQHKEATDPVCATDIAGLDCRNGTENGGLCGTLQSKTDGGYSLNNVHPVRIGKLIRRLTPRECERLQGFPDYWTDIPSASDSARYKALGNSVAIPCVEHVLRGIAYFLRQAKEEWEESKCTPTSTPTI